MERQKSAKLHQKFMCTKRKKVFEKTAFQENGCLENIKMGYNVTS